jgi:hypothetical protein
VGVDFSKEDVHIYIPSAGRASRQVTLSKFPDRWRALTTVIVPEGQRKAYKRSHFDVVECPAENIGATRQWLIDNTHAEYILMMDDDLYFYHRAEPFKVSLVGNSSKDNGKMIDALFEAMIDDGFVHVGVAARPEASFYLCGYKIGTRINNVHGYNVYRMRKLGRSIGARFDKLKLMEDFHVTLTLLENGFPNKVLLDYVWNQPGSNTDGGCSTYRTPEAQAKAARKLAALHPDYVKVVEKKVVGKTSWEGMKTRTDVRIQWHKAYEENNGPHKHWKFERKHVRK